MKPLAIVVVAALALSACGDDGTSEPRTIEQGIDAACAEFDDREASRCRTEAREIYVNCRADQATGSQLDSDPAAVAECESQARAWAP